MFQVWDTGLIPNGFLNRTRHWKGGLFDGSDLRHYYSVAAVRSLEKSPGSDEILLEPGVVGMFRVCLSQLSTSLFVF